MVFAAVVSGPYGAAREQRLANWSAGGRVPEVRKARFTARATGAALQRMLGASVGRAHQQAGADVQNAGRALGARTGAPALA
jgi:hypothetical protein